MNWYDYDIMRATNITDLIKVLFLVAANDDQVIKCIKVNNC